MIIYSLNIVLSQFWTRPLFHVWFWLLFLDLNIGFSGGRWGGLVFTLLKEFSKVSGDPHSKRLWLAEIDVFLGLSWFFDDPVDVGNLISGSSAFLKTSLNIWKFTDHILLKPGLENFQNYFASVLDECNWAEFELSLALPLFWIRMKTHLCQSCGHCWVIHICWHIECSIFTASSLRIWNSSTGIPSPPLAFFVAMPPALQRRHTAHLIQCPHSTPGKLSGGAQGSD